MIGPLLRFGGLGGERHQHGGDVVVAAQLQRDLVSSAAAGSSPTSVGGAGSAATSARGSGR